MTKKEFYHESLLESIENYSNIVEDIENNTDDIGYDCTLLG